MSHFGAFRKKFNESTESIRTHTCGELCIDDVGKNVVITGWIHNTRNMGNLYFVILRDRYGITQIVVNRDNIDMYNQIKKIGHEWVVQFKGTVIERSNKDIKIETGEIEIIPNQIKILNKSLTPPFEIRDDTNGNEDLRMKYRYLDIRRNPIMNNLILRHKTSSAVRKWLCSNNFIDIETPTLIKSTPEGARDFVVPSRMNPGTFYALPQSPQVFKQLLMVAGVDKYFQIARCYRDESLRSDRQLEFTQIDIEMSFVNQHDIMDMAENMIRYIFKTTKNVNLPKFDIMTYDYAMKNYGLDKPDLRFDMKIVEITDIAKGHGFSLFNTAENIIGICVKNVADKYTKKQISNVTKLAKGNLVEAESLICVKINKDNTFSSSISKYYSSEIFESWKNRFNAESNDVLFLMAITKSSKTDKTDHSRIWMGRFRNEIAKLHNLNDPSIYHCLWVVDFPLFEWNDKTNRYHACHHPFTSPYEDDIPLLKINPSLVKAKAYDMIINGIEVGGGSIRISDRNTQNIMFENLSFTQEMIEEQFGFLMKAFEYGAPPHGGIAFGLDRLVSIIGEFENIRDCIAFPKNNKGCDTMISSPSTISSKQLDELNISIIKNTKK